MCTNLFIPIPTQPNKYKSWLAIWDMMSKSNCGQQNHSQKTVHEDNYCLHLLDMCFLWRLVWWGKTKQTTSNEAPTSNKAFAREGRLWWKEKTRKSLPSKERKCNQGRGKAWCQGRQKPRKQNPKLMVTDIEPWMWPSTHHHTIHQKPVMIHPHYQVTKAW